MTVSRRTALAAGAAALPAAAFAAQPPAGRTGTAAGPDPYLAVCLLGGGKRQIEVCRFAQQKLQDADVKAFAQAEIDEHETVKAELAKLGYQPPAPGATPPAGGVRQVEATDRDGQGRMAGGSVTVGKATFSPELSRAVMVDMEVTETCIANAKQHLTKCEQKGKLDKSFVGDQLHTHMGLLDKVTTFQKHASQEMQPTLKTAEGVIRQHIATCEKLMEKLEQTAGRGAGRP